ncbi:MAG: VWA-like domain-containing protein [Promethearchaeota archaeon]
MNADERVSKARKDMFSKCSWMGALGFHLIPKQDLTCPTGWTDGKFLAYNPNYIDESTDVEVFFFVAHEYWHVASFHFDIPFGVNFYEWNVSCDYAANLGLKIAEFVIPNSAYCDEKYRDLSAWQIYIKRRKEKEEQEEQKEQEQEGEKENEQKQSDDNSERDNDNNGGNKEDDKGTDESENANEKDTKDIVDDELKREIDESSKIEKKESDNEEGEGSTQNSSQRRHEFGEVRRPKNDDGSPMSESDINHMKQQWEQNMIYAESIAEKAGDLPGNIKKIMKEMLDPRPDSSDYIRKFVNNQAKDESSWKRLNRRFLSQEIYLPSLHSNKLGHIVVAIDTSGSLYCDEQALQLIIGNLQMIFESYDAVSMTVILCDYKVQDIIELNQGDQIEIEAIGGWGTAFAPVFDYIEEQCLDPVCLLYFTDGENGNERINEPFYPVLWVGSKDFEPLFGDFVRM